MKYSVEISIMNGNSPAFTLQVGEVLRGNFALSYPKMASRINDRMGTLPYARLLGGRMVSSDGYVVSELDVGDGPLTALSWKTVRPHNRKKLENWQAER